jgi:hypothetical protein
VAFANIVSRQALSGPSVPAGTYRCRKRETIPPTAASDEVNSISVGVKGIASITHRALAGATVQVPSEAH